MKVIIKYFDLKIFSLLLDVFSLRLFLFLHVSLYLPHTPYSDAFIKTWIFAECPGIKLVNLPLIGAEKAEIKIIEELIFRAEQF